MLMDTFKMDGMTAIVTGSGRGIGAAIALAFAEAGADVVLSARTQAQLDDVASKVEALGGRAVAVAADLSDREALEGLVTTATAELGRLDVVVNNIGGSMPTPFLSTSTKAFDQALKWNAGTAFALTHAAVPAMLETGGGSVVNIASAAGRQFARGFSAYGTAKAAMIALTGNLAQDLAPRIRVNAICPGAIATDALEVVLQNEELHKLMVDATPMRRLGEPDDIAAAALYLASPASSYVTGAILRVDGGIEGSNLDMGIPDL